MFGLLAFAALAVDHGALMVARGQAQTAADAAALAAAQSMAFDATKDFDQFKTVGQQVGKSNMVWGAAPDILLSDITFPDCPPSPPLGPDTCVQAHVYRNQARNNALPTFFANTFGLASHGVRATATARAVAANATNCLKPWAVGDKWLDTQAGGWSQTATYSPADGDSYIPPSANNYGNGFSERLADGKTPKYYGYQMVLKYANPGQGANELPINSAGWAMELSLSSDAGPINSAGAYEANISGCTTDIVAISPGGPCTAANPAIGCLDVRPGSTGSANSKGVADFIAANDPLATWNKATGTINSSESPSSRIVPVAIFHLPEYLAAGYNGTQGIVRVVNIVGFFLEGTCQTVNGAAREAYLECPGGGMDKSAIVGRVVNYPALSVATGGTVAGSFGTVIVLVR